VSNVRRIQERHRAKAKAAAPEKWRDDYWTLSRLPLHALVFLVPLILLYEVGSVWFLRDASAGGGGVTTQIRAESLLYLFFQHFGAVALMLPGITLAAVLLISHLVRRDRWTVRPMVIVGMFLESAVWVLPLIVMAGVVTDAASRIAGGGLGGGGMAAWGGWVGQAGETLRSMPWQARATIAVGAGVYEELLFRMILIAVCDTLLKVLVEKPATRVVLVVALTSLCFAAYHDAAFTYDHSTGQGFFSVVRTLLHDGPGAAAARVKWGNFIFYAVAGVYFACIYLMRGFGVVVGTHAAYDVAVLVLLSKG